MNKIFKEIRHIDDILPHVWHKEEIAHYVREEEGYQVLNYLYVTPDTFDSDWALECRGIKFDLEGNLIARPFHKFFNLGERQSFRDLDWKNLKYIQTKHDGSMVHPVLLNGEVRLMTRAGFSDQSRAAERYMREHKPELESILKLSLEGGKTPIYEYVSPDNRIVVKYRTTELRLLDIRDNLTGVYSDCCVSHYFTDDLKTFIDEVKDWKDSEGVVFSFNNGHKIKLKADEYVLLHRTKSYLDSEINIVRCILEEKIDDLMPLCSDGDLDNLKKFHKSFADGVLNLRNRVTSFLSETQDLPQKNFALKNIEVNSKFVSSLCFYLRSKEISGPAFKNIYNYLEKRITKQKDLDAIRDDLGGIQWSY